MNQKKKSTNTSPYPDEVIDRLARAFYPAILACWNSEEGQRSLVGARPLHLANARPFGRLKAPLGLSLLRCAAQTRACLWQAEQAHHAPSKEKQSVPDGELPVVHIAIVRGFFRVRPIQGRTLFFTVLHHFPRAASDTPRQHGSGSDAACSGIVPVFCAGMPYKLARKQHHFPVYCPIFAV